MPLYGGAFLMALGSFLLANWGLSLTTWMIICFYGILMLVCDWFMFQLDKEKPTREESVTKDE